MAADGPLPKVRVRESGVAALGASHSRFMLTTDGPKHVKFLRSDGEGPHALANEYLANRVLQLLGVDRPGLALVQMPDLLRTSDPELERVTCLTGLGLDAIPLAQDLSGEMIAAAAEKSPDGELLAQCLVLDWIQSNDHRGRNFIGLRQHRVMAIDFAGSPGEEQWRCHPFDGPARDHGGLSERVRRADATSRETVLAAFDAVTADTLRAIVREMPPEWGTPTECDRIIEKLMTRKEVVRERHTAA